MARYKEQRRQQLASQYGSRDDAGGFPVTPQRRFITRSAASTPVRNGEDRSGSGSSSNSEQPSPVSMLRVRTTRTSRLRAAVTSAGAFTVKVLLGFVLSGTENYRLHSCDINFILYKSLTDFVSQLLVRSTQILAPSRQTHISVENLY
jgi:hypothetical protein